jgi:hypothetical protein
MKLITEYTESDIEYIAEAKDGVKKYAIEGVFAQAETKNRNGRIYPKGIMEGAVKKYDKEQIKTGRAVGELNHPEGPVVNLDKVSHRITDLHFEGNDVVGKAVILDTPMGQIVKGLLEGGVRLGVSTRGMGSLEQREGANYVKEDFMLATVDIVQDPSAHKAFVNGIMEGVEFFYDERGGLREKSTKMRERISRLSESERANQEIKLFKDFLNSLKV